MSTLLSRVAENLYWAARYLERAEGTARVVREHTNLLIDIPTSVLTSWEPLLTITGAEDFDALDESAIVQHLVADTKNPGSIISSVAQARENLRTCREIIPVSAWNAVNDLHLYVTARAPEGVARQSRTRFTDHVIGEHQRIMGILTTMMSRDEAYTMLRLGRHVERADMTTRVLDVLATSLLSDNAPGAGLYDDLLWSSLLRSLSASQMYQRDPGRTDGAAGALDFVLHTSSFPRSVRYCLESVRESVQRLPRPSATLAAVDMSLSILSTVDPAQLSADGVHNMVDRMEIAIGNVHNEISMAYFTAFDASH